MPNRGPAGQPIEATSNHACPAEPRGVNALTVGERFLVWSLRQWVDGWRNGVADSRALREGFATACVQDGMAPFDATMRAVVAGTMRPLDVRCLCCRFVSGDESLFLNVVAAGQRDRDDLMAAAFEEFLAPAAVRLATAGAMRLGTALTSAGLLLPLTAVPGVVRAAATRAAGHGLHLVQ